MGLKSLILLQIAIDIIIIIAFVYFIKKIRIDKQDVSFDNGLKVLEALLADADKISGQFNKQLEEKKYLIKKLHEKLDKKIMSLNLLINRADNLLAPNMGGSDSGCAVLSHNHEKEIIKLAKEGRTIGAIAENLSITKDEVKLVLNLKKKLLQLHKKEGVS